MNNVPIIAISSSNTGVGKTILALNLAAALWSDNYSVKLFAPQNETVQNFMQQRRELCVQSGVNLPMPELVDNPDIPDNDDIKTVIIADIPTIRNQQYADIFSKAHTLISVACKLSDLQWNTTHPYISLIWEAKKNAAARGVKYLNWITVPNEISESTDSILELLKDMAKRYGFRVAETIHFREAFRYIEKGYCSADMVKFPQLFTMSLSDVYARREILTLTDFLWQK